MDHNANLKILQYNVMKSKDTVMAPLFRDRRILDYDILAVQEPWRNPFNKSTTHHPLKDHFHLIYPKDDKARVCFFVSKKLNTTTWTTMHMSMDLCSITIKLYATDLEEDSSNTELIPPPQRIYIHNI